ncbi:MAG: Kelch repeat-containing protein [bacterium]
MTRSKRFTSGFFSFLFFLLALIFCIVCTAEAHWTQKTSIPVEDAYSYSASIHNHTLYVFVRRATGKGEIWAYDLTRDKWTKKTTHPGDGIGAETAVYNGKIYVLGGGGDDIAGTDLAKEMWAYDIQANSWARKDSVPYDLWAASASVYDGNILVFGGEIANSGGFSEKLLTYDVGDNEWSYGDDANHAFHLHTSAIYDEKMYVFGGSYPSVDPNTKNSRELWVYDLEEDDWTEMQDAPFSRSAHTAVVYNDAMYVFGGGEFETDPNSDVIIYPSNELWRYDFISNAWSQVAVPSVQPDIRVQHTAVLYQDKMYVLGGRNQIPPDGGAGDPNHPWLRDLWEYSFTSLQVEFADYMPIDPKKYGVKTFKWTLGNDGQFSSRIEGIETVSYVSGEISGATISNFWYEDSVVISNDGINVKFLEADSEDNRYYASSDCFLSDPPAVLSFDHLDDGMITSGRTFWINKHDMNDCREDDIMILISIQDVKVMNGTYENAVIMWWLDTNYQFVPLNFKTKDIDLGITLPTGSTTNGYSVTDMDIYGRDTGLIASGDISASTGLLKDLKELTGIGTPNIKVNPTIGLTTTECGAKAIFTIVLEIEPDADVIIPVQSNDISEGTVSSNSLTFTSQNWNIPQEITITGVDDPDTDGDVMYSVIIGPVVSEDASYNGLDPNDISVKNKDHRFDAKIDPSVDFSFEPADPDHDLFGLFFNVPQGALNEEKRVTIDRIDAFPDFPSDKEMLGYAVNCGPEGMQFDSDHPAVIGLSYPDDVNPIDIRVYTYDPNGLTWSEIPTKEIDTANKRILFEVTHFSLYTLGQSQTAFPQESGGGGCFIGAALPKRSKSLP